ncbi:M15 family metallopeptidase [Arthrobacter sp. LAPM80]|uniref:M15 family metallopeptidase n=1 Tax=Arthrobacter sp. LAPM80 TaxID=3141788 RepID=UPI00398BB036
MPVVGFHQSRRPRQTPADRLKRELTWPRPGGIAVSLAGAALVFCGAVSLSPASGAASSPAAVSSQASTTAVPGLAPAPIATSTTAPQTTAPLVAGAAAASPIQLLFAPLAAAEALVLDVTAPNSPLVLVNKRHPLTPANYAPSDLVTPNVLSGSTEPALLRAEAGAAAERMFAAAAARGVHITVKSGYRSYDTQASVYNGYVAGKGVDAADSTSARPGFSEHQTGLALDIGDAGADTACDFTTCFAGTAAAQWVDTHGAEYGFVVRYIPGEEDVTGYVAEPWHLRYLGVAVAQDMQLRGIHSYEGYLGLPPAPSYK